MGSPPHVRGPRAAANLKTADNGITPACAGTTNRLGISQQGPGDHPRMCGDHLSCYTNVLLTGGSPPHVRGPRVLAGYVGVFAGITPACAGTTVRFLRFYPSAWDHPRMCGDHWEKNLNLTTRQGSPPHVRGPPNV